MKRLVLFGAGELARLAHLAFEHDSAYEVAACTVNEGRVGDTQLNGLPTVPFERLEETHPPATHALFVAVGYRRVNRSRAELCAQARARGYHLATYVSSKAIVAPDVRLGDNCFVFEGAIIQPYVRIGHGVIVWSGAVIAHDTVVGDYCFIAPHAAISGNVTLGENCFVGINATVRDGIAIAPDCVVGAGAVIKRDTAQWEVYSASATAPSPVLSSQLEDL